MPNQYTPQLVSDAVLDEEVLAAALELLERGIYPSGENIAKHGGVRRDGRRIRASIRRLEAAKRLDRGPKPVVDRSPKRVPKVTVPACPSDRDLKRYLKDRGSEAQGRAITLHLSKCPTCCDRLPRGPSATDLEVRAALRRERDRRGWYVLCPQWEPPEGEAAPPPPAPRSRPLRFHRPGEVFR